jgi:hypothetical protein
MFQAALRSSSGALTVFAAYGLHTHVVTGRSQVWVETLKLNYAQLPPAYVNQRPRIQLELLLVSGVPLETCWAFNERWNNKFYYKVASCWLFLLSRTTMHESMNIKYFRKPCRLWDNVEILVYCRATDAADNKHGACALHALFLRLKLLSQTCDTLLCHYNSCCTNTHHCYVICTLPVLFYYILENHIGVP